MTPTSLLKRNSRIDWAAYGILAAISGAGLMRVNTALDLLYFHTEQLAVVQAWAKVVASHLGIPF